MEMKKYPQYEIKIHIHLRKMNNNNNSNNNSSNRKGSIHPFNSLTQILPNATISNVRKKNTTRTKYFSNKEYQTSFKDVEQFAKQVPESLKQNIRKVIYHQNNTDGYFCAYTIWNYITNGGKDVPNDFQIIGIKPGFQEANRVHPTIERLLPTLKDQYVCMADLNFNMATLQAIANVSKGFLYVDDHGKRVVERGANNRHHFYMFRGVELEHCASAFLYKIIYPNKPVPKVYQYVDNNDSKLYMPHLPYMNEFNVALKVRITSNSLLKREKKMDDPRPGGGLSQLHHLIHQDKPELLIVIGSYMNEQRENIKFEVAGNTYRTKMLGYDVGIINFEVPGFKVLGREMISGSRALGHPIEFAITWSYHHTTHEYHIQGMDDHKQDEKRLHRFYHELEQYIKQNHLGTIKTGWPKGHIFNMKISQADPPKLIQGLLSSNKR
jgi:hypothetical protein